MSANDRIRATVERYVKLMNESDADGIVALYAEDAWIEDPAGSEAVRGREALREFYRRGAGAVRLELTGPVRVSNGMAAFPMRGTLGGPDDPSYLDIIDVMTFGEDGRIASMRAFWSPDAIRKA